jgi:phage gp45-like
MRKVWSRLHGLVFRGVVDSAEDSAQKPVVKVNFLSDRVTDEIEYMQPQGVFFLPVKDAEGLLLAPAGDRASAVEIAAQKRSDTPGGSGIGEGEGGLYYAGTFQVFLDDAGLVHLGGGKSAADFVALAAKVTTELTAIKTALSGAAIVPLDGGASLKSTMLAALATFPGPVAATKVKAT